MHNDAYMTDTYEIDGPAGKKPIVRLKSYAGGNYTCKQVWESPEKSSQVLHRRGFRNRRDVIPGPHRRRAGLHQLRPPADPRPRRHRLPRHHGRPAKDSRRPFLAHCWNRHCGCSRTLAETRFERGAEVRVVSDFFLIWIDEFSYGWQVQYEDGNGQEIEYSPYVDAP